MADAQKHPAYARCLRDAFFPGLPQMLKTTLCFFSWVPRAQGVPADSVAPSKCPETEEFRAGNSAGEGMGACVDKRDVVGGLARLQGEGVG